MRYKITLLSLITWAVSSAVWAQPDQYQFSRIDINNGLSNNQVNTILKDRKGFMWFGSMSGLNRYDGYKCKIFKHDSRDSTSLSDDYITRVMEGPEGLLWVETRNGFNVFDPVTETFERNADKWLKKLSIPVAAVSNIVKDPKWNYWFLMARRSLYKYSSADRSVLLVYQVPEGDQNITSLAFDNQGDFWLVEARGVIQKLDTKTNRIASRTNALADHFKNDSLNYTLFIDAQNELWIYIAGLPFGVVHYKPSSRLLEHIDKDTGQYRLNNNIVVSLAQDNKGRIWISTDHGGINVLNKNTHSIEYVLNNADDNKSLGQNSITVTYKDNAGIIWVGTFKKRYQLLS